MKRLLLPLALVTPLLGGDAKTPLPSNSGWQWTLSVGPSYRNVGQLKINSGYRSKGLFLPSFVGQDSLTVPPVGDENAYADRFYNDGYVRQDAATPVDGSTWFWGYDSSTQVQGDDLVYQATGYQSTLRDSFSAPNAGPSKKGSLRGFSPHIQLDAVGPQQIGGFRLGFSGGFDFTQVDKSIAFSNFSGTQFRDDYRLDYEDRFGLNGVIPPQAPYRGTLAGPGAVIGNVPDRRSITPVLLFTDVADFRNQVYTSIDMDVFSFTLGPSLSRSWGPLDFSFQGGLILSIYNWEARQSEQLTVSKNGNSTAYKTWAEGDSGTKFRPGLYVQADVSHDVGNNFLIGSYLRLDTASEFRAQAGPTVFKVDPSGFNVGFMVRYALP